MPSPRRILLTVLLLCCAVGVAAGATADYLSQIKPLLKERCYACHGALKQNAGLRLDTGESVRKGSKHGQVVLPGDATNSPLFLRVASTNAEERMPPEGDPLTSAQIATLGSWISAGAHAPEPEQAEPDPRDHWAFKKPVRPRPAAVTNRRWVRNPIDTCIAADHERLGLRPAAEARKDILLRRVHLDLVGLPPTREELQAFLADTAPDAYERVVDRLLNSPQYGERWARHWMDIWRYADWYGRRHVPDVWNSAPQVWRWRDWIVRSLNADKGYDRMVAEMLAGDELAPLDDDVAVATGYLVRNWYALNPNQWMRDNVEHTGKAFLGLTFNCAHCHDHKYDPISQADYFNFRAFFEPIYVRQDRWPGEADPGPFQDYEYSAQRKVQKLGAVRVFDKSLAPVTWHYSGGDERNRLTNRPPAQPSLPAFLGGAPARVQSLTLPPAAYYPGLRPRIQETVLDECQAGLVAEKAALPAAKKLRERDSSNRLNAAKLELAEARVASARAALASAAARIKADNARYSGKTDSISPDEISELTHAASLAERRASAGASRVAVANARLAVAEVQPKMASSSSRTNDLEKAAKQLADAEAALAKSEARLADVPSATNYTAFSPVFPATSTGRRRALAEWIVSRENPLTARVAVNHIWTRHFHAPLVVSVFDFGRNGARPTHPELLDWLAVELMGHGWSMKHLHRLIVTSSTYRMASNIEISKPAGADETGGSETSSRLAASSLRRSNSSKDPENRHLWRMNSGQIEAEVVRDSLLYLAGELNLTPTGYPIPNADAETNRHRSLYFECFPEPNGQSAFAEVFDAPNPTECYRRSQTVVPQQALALANSRLSKEQSQSLAQRLAARLPATISPDAPGFIIAAYEQVLARRPTPAELTACRDFLIRPSATSQATHARADLIQALFNHHDFVCIR